LIINLTEFCVWCHLEENSSNFLESNSHVAESGSHVAEFSSHLAESKQCSFSPEFKLCMIFNIEKCCP
jgi:hypothetical protein